MTVDTRLGHRLFILAILLAAAGVAFRGVVAQWGQTALNDNAASHVVLIPVIAAGMIARQRRRMFANVTFAPVAGGLVTLLGILMVALTPSVGLQVAGLVVVAAGGFLLCFGTRAFSAALFPLVFLIFAVPPPPFVVAAMTEFLKVGSTELVAVLFDLTGTPYHRQDFVFTLPRVAIEVGDECSGIRSSIALMLTALMLGEVSLQSTWKKVLLVLTVLPITIVKNGIRIVSLSLLATYVHPSFLVGRLHNDGGVVFFLLALAMLMPIIALLKRSGTRGQQVRPATLPV